MPPDRTGGRQLGDVIGKLRHLSTPMGRRHLWLGARNRAWPLLRVVAGIYRRTLARRVRIVAIVGSYGKTSTAAAVAAALDTTTPAPGSSYAGLALRMLELRPWRTHAVLETAIDGPGQMAPYGAMLRPDLVVVTTIGSEHHRSLGTLDVTQAEKGRMVEALGPGGTAILNADDPRVAAMAARCAGRVIFYGIDAEAEVRATDVALDWPRGMRLTLHVGATSREVRLRLLGRVMVYPFLAAVAAAHAEGMSLDRAIAALETLPPRRGRLQHEPLPGGAWLIRDDFKSSLETMDAALDALAEVPGRRIVVIGSVSEPPGSQGPIYRRLGGRIAAIATRLIVVSSAFRTYAAGARAAGMPRSALVDGHRDLRAVWENLRTELRPGDVVLVKGRGDERLDRIGLALQGRDVRCTIAFCNLRGLRCEACPKLETGWTV
ncbi:MAG: Mur ligase family protein [Geminicoccaceae bacterium]